MFFSKEFLSIILTIATMTGTYRVHSMEPSDQKTIKIRLKGAEHSEVVEVPLAAAQQSKYIKHKLSEWGEKSFNQILILNMPNKRTFGDVINCIQIIDKRGSLIDYVQKISVFVPEFYQLLIAAFNLLIEPLITVCINKLQAAIISQVSHFDWIDDKPNSNDSFFIVQVKNLPKDIKEYLKSSLSITILDWALYLRPHYNEPESLLLYMSKVFPVLQRRYNYSGAILILQLVLEKIGTTLDIIVNIDGMTVLHIIAAHNHSIELQMVLDLAGQNLHELIYCQDIYGSTAADYARGDIKNILDHFMQGIA